MSKPVALIIAAFLSFSADAQETKVHIAHVTTSTALRIAQAIARDEGYDIQNEDKYYFDLHQTADGKPALDGYVTIGFYGDGHIISVISISETTGQTLDMVTCEIFDYSDLRPFQKKIQKWTNAKPQTYSELAEDAGCVREPTVLSNPTPITK